MSKFRLGLIGTGLIAAGSHLPAALGLSEEIEVTALIDSVPDRAAALARTYGISARIAPDIKDALDLVDGVIIAKPNSTHCAIALACIEAGVHVLIEKPLANTVEGRECRAVESETCSNRFQLPPRHYFALRAARAVLRPPRNDTSLRSHRPMATTMTLRRSLHLAGSPWEPARCLGYAGAWKTSRHRQ